VEIAISLFRYKGSKVWTMDFVIHGQRIRGNTGTRFKTLARKIEDNRRRALVEGSAGIKKHRQTDRARVRADFAGCVRSGVNGTPTFFMNGQRHNGSFDFDSFSRAMERAARPHTPLRGE